MARQTAAPRVPKIGPASPTRASADRVVAERAGADDRADEGDEHRRAGLDALAAQLDHVAHLVHEDQHHEADGEGPAPEQGVGGHGDQRGARGGQQLGLRQQQDHAFDRSPELGHRRHDRGGDAAEPLADAARGCPAWRPEGLLGPLAGGRRQRRTARVHSGAGAHGAHRRVRLRRSRHRGRARHGVGIVRSSLSIQTIFAGSLRVSSISQRFRGPIEGARGDPSRVRRDARRATFRGGCGEDTGGPLDRVPGRHLGCLPDAEPG